ncbi:hypothetical protein [Mesorhizobium sp. CAU 1741]|uniref:hypothetical protein n=1 Tax=Mesorhizobium sp. CAU 1741 TaxID=3140366 RepID=UPI00325B0498
MKLYCGRPANPGHLAFHTGTLFSKSAPEGRKQFTKHRIVGLYGVQIGQRFIGVLSIGEWGISSESAGRAALSREGGE